ncbi:MAG: ATP-dependent helicase HrpB [Hyphomicrobiaceae bacterium]|nr:ATP-dependent helicase HrpB [Hyphomicrobiaceae bacterium]
MLPIEDALPQLAAALASHSTAVLVAPPGAGKTTRVPLALLDEPWLAGGRILILEPRRIAARGAAGRMAQTLGEAVGRTVGIRARFGTRVSSDTRIEVMTEGVFTRLVLGNPGLDGIAAVLFDEFHERSLDSDLGLALALDIQSGLRDDLRILVMSATIDGARVANMLGNAPVITSEGRAFPVDTRYLGRDRMGRIEDDMAAAVRRALADETGSILAFLPGQGEILRTAERLAASPLPVGVVLAPLYGALSAGEQDRAIQPAPAGSRKVVLATAIAETSLTIEGVRIVIDSGLARVPRFDPGARVTRLETVRVSRASADQRRGRAGRLEPGVCYRLWDEPETMSLRPFETPEIMAADLAGLVLDCAAWGVSDPGQLTWLDPPPVAGVAAARAELERLGALAAAGGLSAHGQTIGTLALPPHLASMVVRAARSGQVREAASIAAILVERGMGGRSCDLDDRLRAFAADRSARGRDMRALAERWAQAANEVASSPHHRSEPTRSTAGLLALAYPDRIAIARGQPGDFQLASGRGGRLDAAEALASARLLVVAELVGSAAAGRITLAARLDDAELADIAADQIVSSRELSFDTASGSVRARLNRRLGRLVLESRPVPVVGDDAVAQILCAGIAELGIGRLPWSKAQMQLRHRIGFLRRSGDMRAPDLTDAALAADAEGWLQPYLAGKTAAAEIGAADLDAALAGLIPWELQRGLDDAVPTHFTAPTGNRHPIDYEGEGAPRVGLRVQELFGLKVHPSVAGGRLPLTLELHSPAGRPIQVTRDLPGFWAGSWRDVCADMRGRYPKHPWPDDPANAPPTARAKPRGR